MGIANRIVNIFKADVHGVVDQFEDQSLLLKQYLRDMAESLSQERSEIARKTVLRNQIQKEHDKYHGQYRSLDQDLTIAVQKGKDNIARMLIKKMNPLTGVCKELGEQIVTLDEALCQLKDRLSDHQLRYDQLKIRSVEFIHHAEKQKQDKDRLDLFGNNPAGELSKEEIELELLKRKEALGQN